MILITEVKETSQVQIDNDRYYTYLINDLKLEDRASIVLSPK
jgi:hypothetical protein